jgi:hypothetical protein
VIVAAAVCPHPPALVPELAAGAAPELDALRAACDEAVRGLLAAAPELVVAVGSDDEQRTHAGFGPWGVPVPVEPAGPLPLSLLVGRWLLRRAGLIAWEPVPVPAGATVPECAARGAGLASDPRGLALLVLGDGSICRGPRSPGYDDPRAPGYDADVTAALGAADTAALLALDPGLSAELGAAGRAPWQVLAGAVEADRRRWSGHLRYAAAPYGVAYAVASWTAS